MPIKLIVFPVEKEPLQPSRALFCLTGFKFYMLDYTYEYCERQ
jgi:hypothetical protein